MIYNFVGDLHGNRKAMESVLDKIDFENSTTYFVGDYIDRGSDSKFILETIKKLSEDFDVKPTIGNHEKMLLDFVYFGDFKYLEENTNMLTINDLLGTDYYFDNNLRVLSKEDNEDYLVKVRSELIVHELIQWLNTLPNKYELEHHIITHANYITDKPFDTEDTDILLYSRPNLECKNLIGKHIILGHTSSNTWIKSSSNEQPQVYFSDNGYIMIDTENYNYDNARILSYDTETNYYNVK